MRFDATKPFTNWIDEATVYAFQARSTWKADWEWVGNQLVYRHVPVEGDARDKKGRDLVWSYTREDAERMRALYEKPEHELSGIVRATYNGGKLTVIEPEEPPPPTPGRFAVIDV